MGAEFGIGDTETFALGEAEDANLAFVQVVVHLVGRFADLVEIEDGREGWHYLAVVDRLVGVPRFAVVGKV